MFILYNFIFYFESSLILKLLINFNLVINMFFPSILFIY